MNLTAKKLREAANYMADSGANSAHAIATVRGLFDVVESDTFGGDLGRVLNVIADELDELQARAAEANCLRQQLESAEKKAERRKKQVEHTEDAIRERNARLKMRAELLEQAVNENRELRKQVPTECERRILAMWPRFEDGEPVMLGDKYEDNEGHECFASEVYLDIDGLSLVDSEGFRSLYRKGKSVKRPVQSVLDADGVEIKVGDTVWHEDGSEQLVEEMNRYGARCFDGDKRRTFNPKYLTHTRPDSWELLEENAADLDDMPCDFNAKDLIRRAKALAGVEVAE